MKYTILPEASGHFIRIVAFGAIRAEDTASMVMDGLAAAEEAGFTAFLVDYRRCIVSDSTLETFDFMSRLGDLGIPRQAKIAVVISRDETEHHFAETVAVNRGWNIRYFGSLEAAEHWLMS